MRSIADIEIGETAFATLDAISVDEQGRCWVRLTSRIYPEADRLLSFRIRREADGYHIVIPRRKYTIDVLAPIPNHEVQAVTVAFND
jgi:hypothetical protein